MKRHRVLSLAFLVVGLTAGAPALAGTYSKIEQATWQQGVTGLPSYVNMYIFEPASLATKPPILVYTHHCQGSAASSHQSQAAVERIADTTGFIIIYPEATGQNCWDAGSKRSLKHDGGGDTQAVAQMVKYVVSKYSADANRVYAAGDSSGGIMTEALLGVYPDVFMAGVSIMGVPCGCWAEGYQDVTGKNGQWAGACAGGTVTKTGQQWGDLVRSYFPTYKGHRPRLQHWHGETDKTLDFKNVAEDIKEWTNLLGLTEEPTGTEANTPKSGTTHKFWKNSCFTVYETFTLAGVGHMVSADATLMTKYFGLDKKDGEDPETAACGPSAVPGGGSGTGGTGGSTGTGGTTGTGGGGGGTGGRGGATDSKTTGNGGAQGGSTNATTGMAGQGGSTNATTASGGRGGSNGGASSRSSSSSGGSDGGASSSSSSSSAGSKGGSSSVSASSSGNAGSSSSSSSGQAGSSGSSSAGTTSSGSSGGCAFGGQGQGSAFALLALALLGLGLRRQRRR